MMPRLNHYLLLLNLIWPLAACPTLGSGQAKPENADVSLPVSREVYDRTFDEIRTFLKRMDDIIAARDFEAWKANCTPEYVAQNSDPARLNELSQKPYLKEHHIVLASLEDYFINVFIPSRTEATLDKIEFIAGNRVKALTIVGGVPYLLYLLERDENNQWKIGVW